MQYNNNETEMERPTPPFPARKIPKPGLEKDLDPRPQYQGLEYRGSGKLEGKVALITGGDSGIGRAVAVFYAKEGADVAIVHLPEEQEDAEETMEAIRALGRGAISLPGDVGDPEFCRNAVKTTVKTWGHLDILVNNAARQKHIKDIQDLEEKEFEHTFRTNIFGYFYMAKAAIPELPEGGAIINTGSITGLEGSPELLDYSATKGAIHAFTKSLAKNLVSKRIRVNCVAPGPVWTPLNPAENKPEEIARFGEKTPYGRPAQPEEIAPAFVFFASNLDSSYITGEVLSLLGGDTTAG
ncbi:MAG: SDR family oxidoreductase [Pseudobdellovibrionaceae bacterium]|nr:SDR family oxidoreductase [Pseudobdellovibrionaceae bacterium]